MTDRPGQYRVTRREEVTPTGRRVVVELTTWRPPTRRAAAVLAVGLALDEWRWELVVALALYAAAWGLS